MEITKADIVGQIDDLPLSKAVAYGLRIAEAAGKTDFSNWCRLELAGYWASNPAMSEDIVVPEYRSVVGQHADIRGRVLLLPANLAFIGETRLRNGIEELEVLARTQEMVMIHDPGMCELIRHHLHVDVYSFRFSTVHLTGIFSSIRDVMRQNVKKISAAGVASETQDASPRAGKEEILQLKPTFHGVTIDLKALWRRWRGRQ